MDYRIYLPALMEDFTRRGGKIESRGMESDIAPLVARIRSSRWYRPAKDTRSTLHLYARALRLIRSRNAACALASIPVCASLTP